MSNVQPILLNGTWTASSSAQSIQVSNPATGETFPEHFPVSNWDEIDRALQAAHEAFLTVVNWPGERFAAYLEDYALALDAHKETLAQIAHSETGLPAPTRLAGNEIPRTTNQLRQAAQAARQSSWRIPTIDTKNKIRSMYQSIGPAVLMGPNNFPFAYNSISGGDFATALAAGNPVIAKAHPLHLRTTLEMAKLAQEVALKHKLPAGLIQLLYHMSPEDGLKMLEDPRVKVAAFTGSRTAGLKIKHACDKHGKPVFLEMSSVNPVYMLPGALTERGPELVEEFAGSCLLGAGQFCTNPGLVFLVDNPSSQAFLQGVAEKFSAAQPQIMLSTQGRDSFHQSLKFLQKEGAQLVVGGAVVDGHDSKHQPTLLKVTGDQFLSKMTQFQEEAFGSSSLFVIVKDVAQMIVIAGQLQGNLTGSLYSSRDGSDDEIYNRLAPLVNRNVGRLLNDKMPTGVAVSSAMNHGGPFPATGHPGFTAVGMPASVRRFSMLCCYDNVRPERLPVELQDKNPGGIPRFVDDQWTTNDIVTN